MRWTSGLADVAILAGTVPSCGLSPWLLSDAAVVHQFDLRFDDLLAIFGVLQGRVSGRGSFRRGTDSGPAIRPAIGWMAHGP